MDLLIGLLVKIMPVWALLYVESFLYSAFGVDGVLSAILTVWIIIVIAGAAYKTILVSIYESKKFTKKDLVLVITGVYGMVVIIALKIINILFGFLF